MFLSQRRQNKVRITDGHKAQLVLAALAESFSPESPGADGDLGLQNLVAGAALVFLGMQERLNALLLVRFQMTPHVPAQRHKQRNDDQANRRVFPLNAGEEGSDHCNGNEHHRRSQIGLLQDQAYGN